MQARLSLALALIAGLAGCEERLALDDGGVVAAIGVIYAAQSVVDVAPQAIEGRPTTREKGDAGPPEGYVHMKPMARSGTFGHAVILVDERGTMVPIFIGGTEALSIQLRLERHKYSRPLTHDLLDAMVKELGAEVVRSQVDALKDGIYLGTVVVRRDGELLTFDARPSDAIALAIGNGVPIFVSDQVLDEAGEDPEDFDAASARKRPDPVAL